MSPVEEFPPPPPPPIVSAALAGETSPGTLPDVPERMKTVVVASEGTAQRSAAPKHRVLNHHFMVSPPSREPYRRLSNYLPDRALAPQGGSAHRSTTTRVAPLCSLWD